MSHAMVYILFVTIFLNIVHNTIQEEVSNKTDDQNQQQTAKNEEGKDQDNSPFNTPDITLIPDSLLRFFDMGVARTADGVKDVSNTTAGMAKKSFGFFQNRGSGLF